jgi:hypothetical protein
MRADRRRAATCVLAGAFLYVSALLTPPPSIAATTSQLTDDGAWCWFSSPTALYHEGQIYTGWVNQSGDVVAAKHSPFEATTSTHVLHPEFEADDHVHPSFYATSDGRLTALYGYHAHTNTFTTYRVSAADWEIDQWNEEDSTDTNTDGYGGATYANPVATPGAVDSVFLFWRGGDFEPTYASGTFCTETGTWTWSDAQTLITTESGRPYVRYTPCGEDRIGFAFTNGHPGESDAKLYYASIGEVEPGVFGYFRVDGTLIGRLGQYTLTPSDADVVYNGAQSPPGQWTEAWVWDVAADEDGMPYVAFATFPSREHHRYHWAYYDCDHWYQTTLVEDAGGSVADTTVGHTPQYYYSGGLALDRADPHTVYLSRRNEIDGWDLERWKTLDGGLTWNTTPITAGAEDENIRPVVPRGRPHDVDMVLWMKGDYDFYRNFGFPGDDYYDTGIMAWVDDPSSGISDVDGDSDTAGPAMALRPPHPNPTRGFTEITFDLRKTAPVGVRVYNTAGRLVASLLEDHRVGSGATTVVWDGTDGEGRSVPSGVYFIRLATGPEVATSKILVLR